MYFIDDMRRQMRYSRRHLFKFVLALFMSVALFALISTSKPSSIEYFADMPFMRTNPSKPLIVVITPTYKRPTRLADMTRMANTLRHVSDLHWIVVEDNNQKVKHVERLLNRTGLPYSYLAVKTIPGYPKRGWYQRTVALTYLRKNRKQIMGSHKEGVMYFGDDDNSYDIRLFEDYLRNVKKVGLWAVGMVGGTPVESPDVVNGSVVGFKVRWNPARKFAVDMAGFGINLRVVLNSTAVFGTSCTRGAGAPETCLLEDMGLTRKDIEPFGYEKEYDRDLMVWHTKSHQPHYDMAQAKLNGHIFESWTVKNETAAANKTVVAGVKPAENKPAEVKSAEVKKEEETKEEEPKEAAKEEAKEEHKEEAKEKETAKEEEKEEEEEKDAEDDGDQGDGADVPKEGETF